MLIVKYHSCHSISSGEELCTVLDIIREGKFIIFPRFKIKASNVIAVCPFSYIKTNTKEIIFEKNNKTPTIEVFLMRVIIHARC